jgi:membrane protease YdiL (CAAX protease family)
VSAPPDSERPAEESSDRLPAAGGRAGVPRSAVRIPEILGAVLVALGVSVVGFLLVGAIDPSVLDADSNEQSEGGALATQAFTVLGFVVAAVGMTVIANRNGTLDALRRLGLRRFGSEIWPTIGFAVLIYLAAAVAIASTLQPEQENLAENLGADQDATVLVTVLAGVLIIGGAAIGEELFFRGLLFGGLRQLIPLWPAAVVSGVLFGLPHLPQGDLAVALQLSVFGVVLAWAYERSGTLWAPILLHALNNSAAFYLLVTDAI